jgi:ubiquinol-cytochrome c reductase subunit 7
MKGVELLRKLKIWKESSFYKKLAEKHSALMGHREDGLFLDDLIPDETPFVQEAIRRLPPQVQAERLYRMRTALNLSLKKMTLPKEEAVTAEQDVPYLRPVLAQLENEILFRLNFETMKVPKALLERNKSF